MLGVDRQAAKGGMGQRVQRAMRARLKPRYLASSLTLVLMAAAPPSMRALPIPPIPPPPPSATPAPLPDRDVTAPPTPQTTGPKIVPRLLQVPTYQNEFDASAGYVTGSRAQEDQTGRRLSPSPGIRLEIPLR